ncbi:MAG: TonB-dependent receptor, partial [Steroidobacteraceae bacterium]
TFNAVVTGPVIGEPVEPETLDAYTIGQKAEFFDNRVRVNSEVFYYKYKDMQLTSIIPGGTALKNAAEATIKGIDVDITASLFQGFTLTAAFEVLDGEYDKFENGPFWVYEPNPTTFTSNREESRSLKGNDTVNTPPFSVSLRADYVYPTSIGDLDFNLAYNHGGDYYFDPDNGEGQLKKSYDRQPKLDLVDASIGWTSTNGMYDVRLWGKNLTEEEYISFGFEEALLTQYAPAPPRTYGVTLGVHFK